MSAALYRRIASFLSGGTRYIRLRTSRIMDAILVTAFATELSFKNNFVGTVLHSMCQQLTNLCYSLTDLVEQT